MPEYRWPDRNERQVLGKRISRLDGPDKVTGKAKYTSDVNLAGTLHAKFLRCPHAHARVTSIDTSAAESLPGVKAVLTGTDLPDAGDQMVDLGEGPVISVEKPLYHLAVGQGRNRAPGLFGRVSPLGTAAICSKKLAAGHCSLLALRAPAGSVGTGSLGYGPCGRGTTHEACQYLERVAIGL